MTTLKLGATILDRLRCPCCGSPLRTGELEVRCTEGGCESVFPVLDGVPILIDESRSVFAISDFETGRETTFRSSDRALKSAFSAIMPRISKNVHAERNYARLRDQLLHDAPRPKVLIIGGGIAGRGITPLLECKDIELVETDVAIAPRTSMVCDAHDLPFADGTFDGVVAQAVLEHVLDPARCVAELHRVLVPNGLVYAETPFMQQVHMGAYDFTRFTALGHRRLFRQFEEISSGATCGPGMALAWAWQYLLLSFTSRPISRALARGLASLTAFPLKYLDTFLVDTPGGLDAASGIFFTGRRSEATLSDRELVRGYRGAMQ